ncbi:unnamed protein product [Lathyrus oleraceus]
MARATRLVPRFSTTTVIMIILYLGLEKAIGLIDKMDIARYFKRGVWVPLNCRLTRILKPCTENFIGACVHGVDDGCCESICKHSENDK